MIIVLFFSFLFLFFKYKNRNGAAKILLGFYLISALISAVNYIFQIVIDEPINNFAVLYYLICLYLLLYPFIKNGTFSFKDYDFPEKLLKVMSWIFVVSGFIIMYYSIIDLLQKLNTLGSFFEIRQDYYNKNNAGIYEQISSGKPYIYILADYIQLVSYLYPICCFYNLVKGKRKLALLLFITSFSNPIKFASIGEREAALIVVSNYLFAYYFFYDSFTIEIKKMIKKLMFISFGFLVGFIVLMTYLRFSENILEGLVSYMGLQPFNFSYFFNHLSSQSLGGLLNFGYLFPEGERLIGGLGLNDYISSPKYLNVFAGIVGSYFLDFGYWTILISFLFSIFFSTLFKLFNVRRNNKLPFCHFFLQLFLYQVLFMGLFYNEYTSLYYIGTALVSFITFLLYNKFSIKLQK